MRGILCSLALFDGSSAAAAVRVAVRENASPLDFGRGAYVVPGFIKAATGIEPRMVSFASGASSPRPDLDWLFESAIR